MAVALFGADLFKKTSVSLLIFSFAVYLFYVLTQVAWILWDFLSSGVARMVYGISKIFLPYLKMSSSAGDPSILVNGFGIVIGAPCSGIESLSLFIGLFMLMVVYEYKNLDWKRSAIIFALGLAGVYFLNVVRLVLIVAVGTKYPLFAQGMFHSQAGWVLFSIFILALMYFAYPWMVQNKSGMKDKENKRIKKIKRR